jgi:hypothetical protein
MSMIQYDEVDCPELRCNTLQQGLSHQGKGSSLSNLPHLQWLEHARTTSKSGAGSKLVSHNSSEWGSIVHVRNDVHAVPANVSS